MRVDEASREVTFAPVFDLCLSGSSKDNAWSFLIFRSSALMRAFNISFF